MCIRYSYIVSGMEHYTAVIKKINSSGELIWSKTYDNPTESDGYVGDDVIKSVRQVSDGGYIAVGYFRMKIVGAESLGYLRLMNQERSYGQKRIRKIIQQIHGQRMLSKQQTVVLLLQEIIKTTVIGLRRCLENMMIMVS